MSRRNRNKKKKQKLQKKIEKLVGTEKVVKLEVDKEKVNVAKPADTNQDQSIIDPKNRQLISRDVRMILLTMLLLAMILTAIKIFQLKTDLIDNFGNWLVKILNIRTT